MSHGRMGYAKWVFFEPLSLLNVLVFRFKKAISTTGKHVWKVLFKSKEVQSE
jgi:hypothetical protein